MESSAEFWLCHSESSTEDELESGEQLRSSASMGVCIRHRISMLRLSSGQQPKSRCKAASLREQQPAKEGTQNIR
jgi:hypothetical protein|tara:strand:- start:172 stop:396 length:225 start_codon:yes stop_codon:yes gene_type:complete